MHFHGNWGAGVLTRGWLYGKEGSGWALRARGRLSSKKVSLAGHGRNRRERPLAISSPAVGGHQCLCASGMQSPESAWVPALHMAQLLDFPGYVLVRAPCGPRGLNSSSVVFQSLGLFPKSCGLIFLYLSFLAQIPK